MLFVGGVLGDVDAAGALRGHEGHAALGIVHIAHAVKDRVAVHKALEKPGLVGGEPVKGGTEAGQPLKGVQADIEELRQGDLFQLAIAADDLQIAVIHAVGGAASQDDAVLHAAVFQAGGSDAGRDIAADFDQLVAAGEKKALAVAFRHISKQIVIGVAPFVIVGVGAVAAQVEEHTLRCDGLFRRSDRGGDRMLCALGERLAVGADLPNLQPEHAARGSRGRQQLQTAVVVEIRDGIVPGVPVVLLLEIGKAAREELDLLADAVCHVVIVLVRVGYSPQREQHAQREYRCEKLLHIFSPFTYHVLMEPPHLGHLLTKLCCPWIGRL